MLRQISSSTAPVCTKVRAPFPRIFVSIVAVVLCASPLFAGPANQLPQQIDLARVQPLGQAAAHERLFGVRERDSSGLENEALKLTKLGIGDPLHFSSRLAGSRCLAAGLHLVLLDFRQRLHCDLPARHV